ncbi:MAG: AAA family ATPase [Aestuariivita sp.]|nr:AAA family ATPase [Aestuariivita sp.]MCY4346898.1 AAA family ATPase [Aestuariivita sp.]
MTRQRLPIGIQYFTRLRESNSYYVDKTPLIQDLIERGDHYFLSRPRRFGKSLLLDTIKTLFEGRKDLFEGLAIYDHWDWSVSYPVVRLSFDRIYREPRDIERSILSQLNEIEQEATLSTSIWQTAPEYLSDVLYRLHRKTGRPVVVLIDEYDIPILDLLTEPEQARNNRNYLRGFYRTIKGSAEHIRFVFVTGISMFSKVSLFSGLNNLEDISLNPHFSTICGYTDEDLDTVFEPELTDVDRDKVRTWYNGYNWRGEARLYNPFDLLLFFRNREFKPHWFETGSPTFLLQTLMQKRVTPPDLEGVLADESLLSKFDIDDISAEALMFQTGYLTITQEVSAGHRTAYRLNYPNQEVRLGLNDEFLTYLSPKHRIPDAEGHDLCALLEAQDFSGFAETLHALLSDIPYQWDQTTNLADYEAWYASLLLMCFRSIGVSVKKEESSIRGRADMIVELGEKVFVFEFKLADSAAKTHSALEEALKQMRHQGYGEPYKKRTVQLVAVAFVRKLTSPLEVRAEPL